MKNTIEPTEFKEQNVIYAENQKQYNPLPSHKNPQTSRVTSCWKMSVWQRVKFLFTGKIYHYQWTYFEPLQAIGMSLTFEQD